MKIRNGSSADDRSVHLFLSGTVQGVGMRAYVHRLGTSSGLNGWVKNLADGRVEVLIQGPEKKVNPMIEEIRTGRFARYIDAIESAVERASDRLKGFEIRW